MKFLSTGVLALAAVGSTAPEADARYLYPALRPYYGFGYAGPLPGHSYQAVHRLHKREAEADPQLLLNSSPLLFNSPLAYSSVPAPSPLVTSVVNAPVVKSVVEAPAVVSQTIHAAPLPAAAAVYTSAPALPAATAVYTTAPAPVVPATTTAVVGLTPHDCVTEAGCALRTALATGAPAASFGSASVYGRKRREAEAEADAEADPYFLHGYSSYAPYAAYNAFPYNYAPYNYGPYSYAPYNYSPYSAAYPYNVAPAAVSSVEVAAAPVQAVEVAAPAPLVAAPASTTVYHAAAPVASVAPVAVAAPVVRAPAVETVAKKVTYTHLGAHPITPTTVVQTESRLI